MALKEYTIRYARQAPELSGLWDGKVWRGVPELAVDAFRPEGSAHRPSTLVRLLYDAEGIYGIFRVRDRFVRCVQRGYHAPVCRDSCVEFFLQPAGRGGYFNFEFNCGGAMLAAFVTDPTRQGGSFRGCVPLIPQECRQVRVFHSLPPVVEPEIVAETLWHLEFFIPFALLTNRAGKHDLSGKSLWRGNFYKCGDETSHPHWAAWSPVDERNFHRPGCFGTLRFGPGEEKRRG